MELALSSLFKNRLIIDILIYAIYFVFVFYETTRLLSGFHVEDRHYLTFILTCIWSGWAYLNSRFIIHFTLLKRRFGWYILLALSGILITSFLQLVAVKGTIVEGKSNLGQALGNLIIFTILSSFIYLGVKYLLKIRDFFELESVKKEAELNQLKYQLNPHFLFSALNNIYSYNLEHKNYGNDLILRLCQLMRFILESTKHEKIPLREECAFIENYIAFERERLGYRCAISYSKVIHVDSTTFVPPLLLFPLVENAFKHGTNSAGPTQIEISLEESSGRVVLKVVNAIMNNSNRSTHIGLYNLQRRLKLLFPDKSELVIEKTEKTFNALLTIDLS